ncbi:MAG: metalloregulator ArsR/SmtB family transcription factor [Pseudomonadota bacterium]
MKIFTDDSLKLHEAASAFAALGSEQRLTLVQTLVRAGRDGLSVGSLGDRTQISGSTLTHHLKILKTAGLVEQVKEGRVIACTVAFDTLEALSDYLLRNCCSDMEEVTNNG